MPENRYRLNYYDAKKGSRSLSIWYTIPQSNTFDALNWIVLEFQILIPNYVDFIFFSPLLVHRCLWHKCYLIHLELPFFDSWQVRILASLVKMKNRSHSKDSRTMCKLKVNAMVCTLKHKSLNSNPLEWLWLPEETWKPIRNHLRQYPQMLPLESLFSLYEIHLCKKMLLMLIRQHYDIIFVFIHFSV